MDPNETLDDIYYNLLAKLSKQEKDPEDFLNLFILPAVYARDNSMDNKDDYQASGGMFEKNGITEYIREVMLDDDVFQCFQSIKGYILDCLKRRRGLDELLHLLKKSNGRNAPFWNRVDIQDLLICLFKSMDKVHIPKLGYLMSKNGLPIPLFCRESPWDFALHVDYAFELASSPNEYLITSFGTSTTEGKTSLLSNILGLTRGFQTMSTKTGFTHKLSCSFFIDISETPLPYAVADIHGTSFDSPEFNRLVISLTRISAIVCLSVNRKDVDDNGALKDEFKFYLQAVNYAIQYGGSTSMMLLFLRDFDPKFDENLSKTVEANVKTSFPGEFKRAIHTFVVPNIQRFLESNAKDTFLLKLAGQVAGLLPRAPQTMPPIQILPGVYLNPKRRVDELLKGQAMQFQWMEQIFPTKSARAFDFGSIFQFYELEVASVLLAAEEAQQRLNVSKTGVMNLKLEEKASDLRRRRAGLVFPSRFHEVLRKYLMKFELFDIIAFENKLMAWRQGQTERLKADWTEVNEAYNKEKDQTRKDLLRQRLFGIKKELERYDVTFETCLHELTSVRPIPPSFLPENTFMNFLQDYLLSGRPLNLIEGKGLKFGSDPLRQFIASPNFPFGNSKIFVVAVIGAQSSAKSTLLNYLTGSYFATSSGRTTKGCYLSLHPLSTNKEIRGQGEKPTLLAVLDTEGLLSVEARDKLFDTMIATFTFANSHAVIINNKGEITKTLEELLEMAAFALNNMRGLKRKKPHLFFSLRDQSTSSYVLQKKMVLQMKEVLRTNTRLLNVRVEDLFHLDPNNVFLFPPAITLQQSPLTGRPMQGKNELFSLKAFEMRHRIVDAICNQKESDQPYMNFPSFYKDAENIWKAIFESRSDLTNAKAFLERIIKEQLAELAQGLLAKYTSLLSEDVDKSLNDLLDQKDADFSFGKLKDIINSKSQARQNQALEEFRHLASQREYGTFEGTKKELEERIESTFQWKCTDLAQYYQTKLNEKLIDRRKVNIVKKFQEQVYLRKFEDLASSEGRRQFDEYFTRMHGKLMEEVGQLLTERLPNDDIIADFLANYYAMIVLERKLTIIKQYPILTSRVITKGDIIGLGRAPTSAQNAKEIYFTLGPFSNTRSTALVSKFLDDLTRVYEGQLVPKSYNESDLLALLQAVENKVEKLAEDGKMNVPEEIPAVFEAMVRCILGKIFMRWKEFTRQFGDAVRKEAADQINLWKRQTENVISVGNDSNTLGITIGEDLLRSILDVFTNELEEECNQRLYRDLRGAFPTPERMNNKAYEESFGTCNPTHILKYVLDINEFTKEMYEKETMALLTNITKDLIINKRLVYNRLISQLLVIIQEWVKTSQLMKGSTKPTLKDLETRLKSNPEVSPYINNVLCFSRDVVIDYPDILLNAMTNIFKVFETNESEIEAIANRVAAKTQKEYIISRYTTISGCQKTCPICANKCILEANHPGSHKAHHLLPAFHCCTYVANPKTVVLKKGYCDSTLNLQSEWYHGDHTYPTLSELLDKVYPQWKDDFPPAQDTYKHRNSVLEIDKKAWIAIREPFLKYFDLTDKDEMPEDWKTLDVSHQLPRTFRLDRPYMS